MKVAKVYKEEMPEVRLIGKKYSLADRDAAGSFATQWQQWFQEGRSDLLKECSTIPDISMDSLGVMRMSGSTADIFEYWIGAFFAPESAVPEGFQSEIIPAGTVGVCWLSGNDKSGELYGPDASDISMAAFAEKGLSFSDDTWFFERYHHERFTTPDLEGNVVLDICVYLNR